MGSFPSAFQNSFSVEGCWKRMFILEDVSEGNGSWAYPPKWDHLNSNLESLKHSRLSHHPGGTQALEASEVHRGVLTHRHVWEPLDSGIKPVEAQADRCRMHRQGAAGVG